MPASKLAKDFKYTSDYIGQLCRAKKVDAQLVGRSWYVNPNSLADHKSGRYNKVESTKPKTKVSKEDEAVEVKIKRIDVSAPVTKNAIRMSSRTPSQESNFAKRVVWKPIKYESDEGALYPQMREEIPNARIPVELAGSTEITISKATKITNLVAEPLPTISLKGKLSVSSLDHDDEEVAPLGDVPLPQTEKVPVSAIHHSLPRRNSRSNDKQLITMSRVVKPVILERKVVEVVSRPRFAPESIVETEEVVSFEYLRVTLLTTSAVLFICLLGLFFSESSVSATSGSYSWGIDFSTQSLTALLSLF